VDIREERGVAAVHPFPFSLEGRVAGMIVGGTPWPLYGAFISLCRVIRVHTLVGEVDIGVRRAARASVTRGSRAWPLCGTKPRCSTGGVLTGVVSGLPMAYFGDPKGDFLPGGTAM
jgi:hypothetical protein